MKNIKLITLIFVFIFNFKSIAKAQSPSVMPTLTVTSKSSPTPEDKDLIDKLKQIEIFKEKIATKVAQVRNEDKGARYGKIKSLIKNELEIISFTGDKKINYSEDTIIYKLSDGLAKEAASKDLVKDINVSTFGNFAENKQILLAKYIYIEEDFIRKNGKIADVDKNNFTINVRTKEGDIVIDFEKYTKTIIFEKGKGIIKGGFSKFKTGDTVYMVVTKNDKEENRYFAQRIILLQTPIPSPSKTPEK